MAARIIANTYSNEPDTDISPQGHFPTGTHQEQLDHEGFLLGWEWGGVDWDGKNEGEERMRVED